jgi:sodium-dependent dicarboxylate transporter 2/3/5
MNPESRDLEREAEALSTYSEQEAAFDRWRKLAGAVLAPLGSLATWLVTADSLQPGGRSLAAVLVGVVVLWVTEVVPLPVTAVLGPAICIVLGVADAKTVLTPFADPIVFLFLGSFILARAMMLHRLDRRIALAFLSIRWIGGHPGRVLAGLGAVTALLSMWVSNTATTAMMLPIGLGILQALQPTRGDASSTSLRVWPYATGMMLMIAFAASIGGIGTPVGSPPNLIAIGLIRSLAGAEISFFRWMALAIPMVLAMGSVLFVLLRLLHPAGTVARDTEELTKYIEQQRAALGPWTAGQRNTLVAFALAVVLWTLPGFLSIGLAKGHPLMEFFESRMPEAVAALGAASLLFLLPVDLRRGRVTLTWEEAAQIDWGVLLLFGGGLSLGTLMFQTGVAQAMARGITALTGAGSLWTLTAAAIALGIVVSETTSNTAAANMVIPAVIALAQAAGVNAVPPALGACFGASFGFMLPVSTPPNAIVYGSGLVPISKMMRAGILFDIAGFLTIFVSLRILGPLLALC